MRHIWSVLCQHAFEDKNSNNYSLIDALYQVSFKGDILTDRPINLHFRHHIVSLWCRKDDQDQCDYPVRVRVIAPGNVELRVSAELTVKLSEYDNFKTNFSSDTFPFTDTGIYEFEISYQQGGEWIVATQIPLKVTHRQPETEEDSESTE